MKLQECDLITKQHGHVNREASLQDGEQQSQLSAESEAVLVINCVLCPALVKGVPEFIKETPDCTYLFSWPTALACIPVKTTSCSYK